MLNEPECRANDFPSIFKIRAEKSLTIGATTAVPGLQVHVLNKSRAFQAPLRKGSPLESLNSS